MKKHLSILIACSILFNACTTGRIHTLKRIPESNGHNKIVKQQIVAHSEDKQKSEFSIMRSYQNSRISSHIWIPVELSENKDYLPAKLPESLKENKDLWRETCELSPSSGLKCNFNRDSLEFVLNYYKQDAKGTGCYGVVVDALISPLLFFTPLIFVPLDLFACIRPVKITPSFQNATVNFLPYETRGVSVEYRSTPRKIDLVCDSKKCSFLDENKKSINKIFVEKIYRADKKEINKMLAEEAKERMRQQRIEAKKRKEEARRIANIRKNCPILYDVLYVKGGQYTFDLITKTKLLRKWSEFDCNLWLNEQLHSM